MDRLELYKLIPAVYIVWIVDSCKLDWVASDENDGDSEHDEESEDGFPLHDFSAPHLESLDDESTKNSSSSSSRYDKNT